MNVEINKRRDRPLPGRGSARSGRGDDIRSDLGGSGVASWSACYGRYAPSSVLLASNGVTGHGATAALALALLVAILVSADRYRRRKRRRRTSRLSLAIVVGLVVLIVALVYLATRTFA